MEEVTIEIYGEYISSAKLPNGTIITSTICNINTIEAFLEDSNGIYTLYISSKLPFATLRTLSQKLGVMASQAMLHASNEKSLLTVVGGIKIMNKLLRG